MSYCRTMMAGGSTTSGFVLALAGRNLGAVATRPRRSGRCIPVEAATHGTCRLACFATLGPGEVTVAGSRGHGATRHARGSQFAGPSLQGLVLDSWNHETSLTCSPWGRGIGRGRLGVAGAAVGRGIALDALLDTFLEWVARWPGRCTAPRCLANKPVAPEPDYIDHFTTRLVTRTAMRRAPSDQKPIKVLHRFPNPARK